SPSPRLTPGGLGMPNPALRRSPMPADSNFAGAVSLGRHAHSTLPVLASSAFSREPAETNMTPSFKTGVARVEAFPSHLYVHAPPRVFTFCALIWSRPE